MENKDTIETLNMAEETVVNDGIVEELSNKKTKKPIIVFGIVVAVAGIAAVVHKCKSKIKNLGIQRASKILVDNGYTVLNTAALDELDDDVEVNP